MCFTKGTVVHYQNDEPVVEYHLWTQQWKEMLDNSLKFSKDKWPLASHCCWQVLWQTPEEFKNAVEKGWYESTVFTLFQRIVGQGSGFRRFLLTENGGISIACAHKAAGMKHRKSGIGVPKQ